MSAVQAKAPPASRMVLLSQDEDGYFVVEVPSLSGCISQGRTRAEALNNIRDAIALHIEVLQERNQPISEDNIEAVAL